VKRSGKFYYKNEREVMESLGLKQVVGSGNTWLAKEDGSNDFILCQLKSTDAQSIKVNQKDIRMLEKNASVEHKLPVFAIQFLNTGEIWLMAKPEDFTEVSSYIKTGECRKTENIDVEDIPTQLKKSKIKSSISGRELFHAEKEKKFNKTKSAR
jgi:hypothetical protein